MPGVKFSKSAFSLMEIVVSVAILGILSLVGILSYSESFFSSKDAVRISDLERIQAALRNEKQKGGAYPKPGRSFALVASGASNPVAHQGIFDSKACGDSLSGVPTDPVTKLHYPYSVRTGQQTYQVAAIQEESETRAVVLGDYLPAAPTVLPSLLVAVNAEPGTCVEIRDGISGGCGNGSENRKKFVLNGSRSNLPYDGDGQPFSGATSFEEAFSWSGVSTPGNPRHGDCGEIRESGDYVGSGEYRIVDEWGTKQTAICE